MYGRLTAVAKFEGAIGLVLVGGTARQTLYSGWDGAERVPVMIGGLISLMVTSAFWYILTVCSVKMAVHWWSHILPTESRDPEARLGKPCECVADGGK